MTIPQIPGARVRSRRGDAKWDVSVPRVHALQQLAVASVGTGAISELEVSVAHWRAPWAGWIGRPGLAGISGLEVEARGDGARVRISTTAATDPALLLAAAVRCLRALPTGDEGPMLTFAPGLPASAASLAGQVHDVLRPGEQPDPHLRRCDILITPGPEIERGADGSSVVVVAEREWTRNGVRHEVTIDPTVHRPIGRRSTGATAIATVTATGAGLTITTAGRTLAIDGDLSGTDAVALRGTLAVRSEGELPARWRHQLQACGVVVTDLATPLPPVEDDLAWQAWSVHERRHALRQFGPAAALDAWPSVSVILATHRADHLEHALRQVAQLRYPRLEVVIGAHGGAVDPARVWELAQDVPHPVSVVVVDGSRTLGETLQQCCDRAEGTLITKMDDDDHYGPEHVWDLVLARMYSGAQIVGKALDWIHIASEDVTVFRPVYAAEKYADFVAGGTMLISRADLGAVGGWRPVPKSVDRALLDRVIADGGLVYRTHGLGYVYVRHSAGHTATVKDEHFLTKTTARHDGLIRHDAFGTGEAS